MITKVLGRLRRLAADVADGLKDPDGTKKRVEPAFSTKTIPPRMLAEAPGRLKLTSGVRFWVIFGRGTDLPLS